MTGGRTPRAILLHMQEEIVKLNDDLSESYQTPGVIELGQALVRVMSELDIAVRRSGRI